MRFVLVKWELTQTVSLCVTWEKKCLNFTFLFYKMDLILKLKSIQRIKIM